MAQLSDPDVYLLTRYLNHYRDNSVAHETDIPTVNRLLYIAQSDFRYHSTLLDQIAVLERDLKKRKQRIGVAISRLRAIVKPSIHRLPAELLISVFRLCMADGDAEDCSHDPGCGGLTPLILGQVCSRWRLIVNETPSLWCRIEAVLGGDSSGGNILNRTRHFLTQSRAHPLHIFLDARQVHKLTDDHLSVVFELFDASSRWKTIKLLFSTSLSTPPLPSYLPLLERLEVESCAIALSRHPLFAPFLVGVSLRQHQNNDASVWAIMDHLGPDSCVELVGRYNITRPLLTIVSPIAVLRVQGILPFGDFFDHLRLPSLRELTLHVPSLETSPFPVDTFRRFLARSRPPISYFSIHNFTMGTLDLIGILQILPDVRHLSIWEPRLPFHPLQAPLLGTEFMHWMSTTTITLSGSVCHDVLPHLTHLHLGYRYSHVDDDSFLNMLSSRHLQRLTLDRGRIPDLDVNTLRCLEDIETMVNLL